MKVLCNIWATLLKKTEKTTQNINLILQNQQNIVYNIRITNFILVKNVAHCYFIQFSSFLLDTM